MLFSLSYVCKVAKYPPNIIMEKMIGQAQTHMKYTKTVYPYIPASFNYSNTGWPHTKVLPKLELVPHYITFAQRLI